jgi:hypothetical protein
MTVSSSGSPPASLKWSTQSPLWTPAERRVPERTGAVDGAAAAGREGRTVNPTDLARETPEAVPPKKGAGAAEDNQAGR